MSLPRPKTRRRIGPAAFGGLFLVCGVALLAWQLLSPASLERAVGEAKVAIQQVAQEVTPGWTGPVVRLGPAGGIRELNWCDGRFIEMTSYRVTGVPPVYAAHNNCGGDIILGWQLGDHVMIEGSDTVYEVVEERHTPKWTMVTSLKGMAGDLVLQTCLYGQNRMRFLSLSPVSG